MKFRKVFTIVFLFFMFLSLSANAGLTFSSIHYENAGSEVLVYGRVSFDSSYPTGGEVVQNHILGLNSVSQMLIPTSSGYVFAYDITNKKILAYQSGAATPAGTLSSTSGGTPAGTNSAPAFTGTSPTSALDLASPAFSGTGLTAAGQVITTTSTHTMTLNQCAGMWLLSATGATPPNLILSNTAVTGAAAVLTVQGAASTDAGAYKIVKALTPIGSVAAPTFSGSALSTHTHTFSGSATAAAALAQVPNTTDLSTVTSVPFMALGKY